MLTLFSPTLNPVNRSVRRPVGHRDRPFAEVHTVSP
jgi:hypothetical protein